MDVLKFVVLDEEDLEVASTHLQDAVVTVSDVHWRPGKSGSSSGSIALTGKVHAKRIVSIGAAGRRCVLSGFCHASVRT